MLLVQIRNADRIRKDILKFLRGFQGNRHAGPVEPGELLELKSPTFLQMFD